jgi:hypothetical protein
MTNESCIISDYSTTQFSHALDKFRPKNIFALEVNSSLMILNVVIQDVLEEIRNKVSRMT